MLHGSKCIGKSNKEKILYVKYYCGREMLLTEKQRGIYGQNVANVIQPVSGLGNARINLNRTTEFCTSGSNQQVLRYNLLKHLIFPKTYKIIPAT